MKIRTDRAYARGFTLLEVLCVIALVGMASMMVMLSIPHNGHQRQDEYQKIQTRIAQTAQQAQLTGDVYGFRLLPDGWEIVVLRRNQSAASLQQTEQSPVAGYHWQLASYGRHVVRHQLPADFQLTLLTDTQRFDSGTSADPAAAPQVLFLPGGEVTPFRFYLRDITDRQAQAVQPVIHINDRGIIAESEGQIADTPG
ncbi:hypothetical protein COO59_07320 [Mixta theicola]|uniref:Type II secretion system protein H n=1 Tax=Mixta theicola TaxID=1458355 RepID=A0A2K1QB98_9GAMM|nr:type II secretion system minor pseudopilin GspH [Mixta theicola]PNS12304.1 hypothetical protein COO59_07320 [Mixta theicola]GLR08061.1 type II secretion system protein GspH [Mixta theicola]